MTDQIADSSLEAHPGSEEGDLDAFLREVEDHLDSGAVPADVIGNPDLHRVEMERIFGRCWLFVGHESEIAEPGDYVRRYLGNDPYILVRDEDGDVNVLFDRCQHRGTRICESDRGNTSHFRCPYHGWTYDNRGDLVGVPYKSKSYPHIDAEDVSLFSAPQVENYAGFVFASLDPDTPPLDAYLGDATWYLDIHFQMADWEVVGTPVRWTVNLDWKTVSENASTDNYHVFIGHKSATDTGLGPTTGLDWFSDDTETTKLNAACDVLSYSCNTVETESALLWGYPEELVDLGPLDEEQTRFAERALVTTANVFPNLNINHSASTHDPDVDSVGTFMLRQWRPIGPGEIEVWNWSLVPKSAPEEFRERSYNASTGAFGIAGNFFVDDMAILDGIAETSNSVTARKHDMTMNYSMRAGRSAARRLDDFEGPGTAYADAAWTDEPQLEIYRNWVRWMRG